MAKYNREEILEAGVEMLSTKGFSGLGVQNVLKTCGIPKGSFYNFFESKDAFVIEALSLYNERVINLLQAIDENSKLNPIEKINLYYQESNEFFYNNGSFRTCPMMNTVSDDVENKKIINVIHESMDSHKAYITKWIIVAEEAKLIHHKKDPVALTHMIYDNFHGAVLRMKYEQSRGALDKFLQEVLPLYLS